MTLKELLEDRGIKKALIVDDACDETPRANDLLDHADQWSNFISDADPEVLAQVDADSPETQDIEFDAKIARDEYVAAVWTHRDALAGPATALFETYEGRQKADMVHVDTSRAIVAGLGLEVETAGREFEDKAASADLILIDLYLGGAQNDQAMEESMDRLANVVAERKDHPPLVVLMSRSPQLMARRDQFRDKVGLVESGFRILAKSDLFVEGRLERQIERLADNQPETLKLARFFAALEDGISQAAERTLGVMRRMTLSDIAQIQQLLLDAEEAPAGSYLVDVFDRVLQHEVECEEPIIKAAIELNELAPERHPPAYVAGSMQLQDVVQRTLAQAHVRLQLAGTPHSKVTFGDLIRVRKIVKPSKRSKGVVWPSGVTEANIFLVLTPVCDLQHGQSPRVLLMVGEVRELSQEVWTYAGDARTPAIMIDDKLVWIKWDLKHVDTVTAAILDDALKDGRVEIVARLRDAHALELQQKLLAGLGRVGLLAPMPATFQVSVEAYVTDKDRKLVPLDVPELEQEGGILWVGRDKKSTNQVKKFVLRETPADALLEALMKVDPAQVASESRGILKELKTSNELSSMLTAGVNVTKIKAAWLPIERIKGAPFLSIAEELELPKELTKQEAGKGAVLLILRKAATDVDDDGGSATLAGAGG